MQAAAMFPDVKSFRESWVTFQTKLNSARLTYVSVTDEIKRLIAKFPEGYEGFEDQITASAVDTWTPSTFS